MGRGGGGIKPGSEHGTTDPFSYNIVSGGVHVNDLNATILHCLGVDHERLTFPFQGLDPRLTGVEPHGPVYPVLTCCRAAAASEVRPAGDATGNPSAT